MRGLNLFLAAEGVRSLRTSVTLLPQGPGLRASGDKLRGGHVPPRPDQKVMRHPPPSRKRGFIILRKGQGLPVLGGAARKISGLGQMTDPDYKKFGFLQKSKTAFGLMR